MNVIFIEPSFPYNQREFVRALKAAGAHVIGIGERPVEHLTDELKNWLGDYVQVPSVVHAGQLYDAVKAVQGKMWVDRLEATIEAHVLAAATVREATGIPGTSKETTFLCRDKPAMKEVLRRAGVPCAMSTRAKSAEDALQFAREVGYPLIVKPVDGAGASGTHRVDDDGSLKRVLAHSGVEHGAEVAIEEFIEGHEGFIDTITINGEVAHEFITHYYPNVLVAMRERWISPQMVTTNRIYEPGYEEVRALTRKVIQILGVGTSATHMEWFFGPKGMKFSEIGARPPGVGQWDVYNAANELDLYFEWASAIVHGRTHKQPSRRFAAGMLALRPERDGHITGYSGVDEIQRRYGDCVVASHLPNPGTPTQPVEAGYMANAWVRARHPDYDELRRILNEMGETIRVHAQ